MKKILISLALVGVLLLATAVPAMAATEQSTGASVTVNTYMAITLTDKGTAGIGFGAVDINTTDNPDTTPTTFSTDGSVVVDVATETNVSVDLQIKQSADWIVTTWPATDSEYETSYTGTPGNDLTTSYVDINGGTAKSGGDSVTVWHYLDVPNAQITPTTYNVTYYYQCIAA